MHIEIDRGPRGPEEGIALTVYARANKEDIYQFKIDVWSEKNSGIYQMRLDGFGYLQYVELTTPHEIFLTLHSIDPADVERQANQFQDHIRTQLEAQRQEGSLPVELSNFSVPLSSELTVGEYFQAAKEATLQELAPNETGRTDGYPE